MFLLSMFLVRFNDIKHDFHVHLNSKYYRI